MLLSKCAISGSKKSTFTFIKKQEANGILSRLGVKTPLLGNILF